MLRLHATQQPQAHYLRLTSGQCYTSKISWSEISLPSPKVPMLFKLKVRIITRVHIYQITWPYHSHLRNISLVNLEVGPCMYI